MAEDSTTTQRALLQAERERLVDQLRQLGHGPAAELDYDEGFADTGQVTAERGEADALAATLEDTLRELDDALAKVDAGTYGRCEHCGEEISPARLEAMPAARHCIACARIAAD